MVLVLYEFVQSFCLTVCTDQDLVSIYNVLDDFGETGLAL